MMIVYHWTTKENAEKIMREELRQWTFVCKDQDGWEREVCLAIEGFEIDWRNRDIHTDWQAIAHEYVPPERIRVLEDK